MAFSTKKTQYFAITAASNEGEYWEESKRPLACLLFLLPLLGLYEWGVVRYGGNHPESVRNGADYWMRSWLRQAGLAFELLLPCLVLMSLLGWHLASRQPWRIARETIAGMFAESLLCAFCLVVIGQLTDLVFQRISTPALTMSASGPSRTSIAVTYVGAGIYEEVMFRLCLLPLCFVAFRAMRLKTGWAAFLAMLTSSLVFSLAHYIGEAGEPFELFTFAFRTIAGLFFAALFVARGFGITVGCHAAYDLLVGLLMDFSR
ncbi:MAG: CPBP family glutamic-type intramembrane protease [Planctomycetaceae bacterium]